jgi:hypothetical protein
VCCSGFFSNRLLRFAATSISFGETGFSDARRQLPLADVIPRQSASGLLAYRTTFEDALLNRLIIGTGGNRALMFAFLRTIVNMVH